MFKERTFEFEMSLYDDDDREILVSVEMFSGSEGSCSREYGYPPLSPDISGLDAVWADTGVPLTKDEITKFVKTQEHRIYDYGLEYEAETRDDGPEYDKYANDK